MPKGLMTSLLIKLTMDFWYLTLIALLIKLFLIRFTVTDSKLKILSIWLLGNTAFYFAACIAGIVFTTLGYYYLPFVMFSFAITMELIFCSVLLKIEYKRLLPEAVIGDGIFFFLMFMQMA